MTKTHRPCLELALVLMAGIAAGKYAGLPLWLWLAASVVLLGVLAGFWRKVFAGAFIYALVFCLGAAWLVQRSLLPSDSIAFLHYDELARVASEVRIEQKMRSRKNV